MSVNRFPQKETQGNLFTAGLSRAIGFAPRGRALHGLGLGKERRALLVDRDGFFESGHVIYLYLHCYWHDEGI